MNSDNALMLPHARHRKDNTVSCTAASIAAIIVLGLLAAGCGPASEAEVERDVYETAYRIGDPIGSVYGRNTTAFHTCLRTRDPDAWPDWSGFATEDWYLEGCSDGVHGRGSKYDEKE